ncbi:MAG: SDR family oxidoreductase [Verrucomicrobia bacterium]|nr:SDR family oxidoreductase [Verrucomicrobiota bacterium]
MPPIAWITGAGGLIGSHLLERAPECAPHWRAIGLTRAQLDLSDFDAVRRRFEQERPALILHCAALSRSVACETDPTLARRLNVELTAHLAGLARDIPFVFFSTDLVFDGRQGHYRESDATAPLGVYAATTAEAERIVLAHPGHTVIRTSLNGGTSPTGDRAFNEEMRRAWQNGRTLRLFTDEFRCPIPAGITARAVWELAGQNRPGLYHLAGRERLSRFQIGQLIAQRWPQLRPQIEPGSLRDYQGAPRAPDTSLDCTRLQSLLSFPLPGLTEYLETHPDEPF